MSEKKKTIMRNNVIYRSLRRSSSRVAYALKKKVSNVHKTLENNMRPRKAMQPLNESFGSPHTPIRFNIHDYVNEALSVTPLASTSVVCSAVSPSSSEIKQRTPSRVSKQLARCRIWEIQSPKRWFALHSIDRG
uniref:Uncharacterized protein n=1 Tax=Plectus sambesii TaxID=2011161 RepID=A0A914X9K5_9BILA